MAISLKSSLANKTVTQVMSRDSRYSITFNLRETYASSSENYSICSYELTATKSAGGGYFTNYVNNPVYVEINRQVVFNQNINYDFSTSTPCTITLASGTIRIPHNNNGTKNVSFSASFTDVDNALGSASINDNVDLFTIPRESSVGVSDTYIGSTATIVINKNDDSFVHTLKYSFEGLSDIIVTKTSQSVYTWTVPTDFYEKIPNSKSGVCTITCQTYNGDTLIGTSTTTFRAMVNEESNKPIVSALLEDVNPTTLALTGDKNTIIKYLSNVKTVITAIPKNSATIKSYKVICGDGKVTTESTSILNGVESNKFSISSTDSRGFSSTIEKTMTMIDYIRLAFTEAFITRPETTSTTLNFNCRGNWYNGGFSSTNSNALTLKFRFKEKNSEYSDYQNLTISTNNNTFSFNGALGNSFDYKKQYDFEFVLSDKAMSSIITFNVESGQSIVRVAEHYVRIAGDLYINDKQVFGYDIVNSKNKTYKLTEEHYIDTTAIKHNNELLNSVLNNLFENYNLYTTSEQMIGYFDGKQLYRKIIKANKIQFGSTTVNVAHGIANLGIVTDIHALWKTDEGARRIIPSTYYGTLSWASQIVANDTNVVFEVGEEVSWRLKNNYYDYVYVIMEYTKTT